MWLMISPQNAFNFILVVSIIFQHKMNTVHFYIAMSNDKYPAQFKFNKLLVVLKLKLVLRCKLACFY